MKYIRQIFIIFGITMTGEVLSAIPPLPVPSRVYGLFLMLPGLCTEVVKISDVEDVGSFLLDTMPMMLIPVSIGLIESYGVMKAVLVPLFATSVISTIIVMVVTDKMTELTIHLTRKGGEAQ